MQDIYAFAAPLLTQKIKEQYGLELDVKTTYLTIYTSKKLPWYTFDLSNGVTSRKVSLLDAALHNFASKEKFEEPSHYISQPDYRGHFKILPYHHTMSLEQFKQLCRALDLGSLYQRHLNDYLLPTEPVAQAVLKLNVIASQKAALKAAAFMAWSKKALGRGAYAVVTRVLDGTEKRARCYRLSLLGIPLTGILLIARDLENVSKVSRLIAYIPHDPISPMKAYNSSAEFMSDLARKLRLNARLPSSQEVPAQTYQLFFSQFVPHAQRGVFFTTLTERLYEGRWNERGPQEPGPAGCEFWTSTPMLQLKGTPIVGDIWEQHYEAALNKILNDGKSLAVSTAQADSNERWAWWENALKIGADLLNAALLVVTPFVPLLGELMLAYTAYQMTDELVEGIVDLSEGQVQEAAQHICAVITDALQIALMAGGGFLAKELLFKPSPFVDGLKPVQVGDKTRLWNPDPAPYARSDLSLPSGAKPGKSGVYDHQGQNVVRVGDQHFVLEHDVENDIHRVVHPTRRNAYSPVIEPNGSGAWVHEGEDPWTWDDSQLRSRLGHIAQGLSADEVERACHASGTHAGALRKMYLHRETTPALLADSLKRLKLLSESRQLPHRVRAGEPLPEWFNWSAQLLTEHEGWPAEKAITVVDTDDTAMTFGAENANAPHRLTVPLRDVQAGKLPERLVPFLAVNELQTMLPAPTPETTDARVGAIRHLLADNLEREQIATFNHLYSTGEIIDSVPGRLLQQAFPRLPAELVAPLMLRTSPREVAVMHDEQRIPLRLKNLARGLQNEIIASHAMEGFYDDALLSADTERMALNVLRHYTDALGQVRLTVREQVPTGPVRCGAGPHDGVERILLRQQDGRYALIDAASQGVQPRYDFFEALLRALPADKIDYVPGQGRLFKLWLKDQLEPPTERPTLVAATALRQTDQREISRLLQKPMFGAFRRLLRGESAAPLTPEQRLRTLCPLLSDAQAQSILPSLETPASRQRLGALEQQKSELLERLEHWKKRPTVASRHSMAAANETLMRGHIINELRSNWEAAAPGHLNEAAFNPDSTLLDLSETTLGRYIRSLELPAGSFDHVVGLHLGTTRLGDADTGFLKYFPNVHELSLAENLFTRMPAELSALTQLRVLGLQHNPIRWQPTDYQALTHCPRLRWLDLQGNMQLSTPPDLNSLPSLEYLNMHGTGIRDWPVGLDQPRASVLELNMLNTQVNSVPDYPRQSQAVQVIARSWLDRSKLEPDDEQRFVDYRRPWGIDPYRTAPGGGAADSAFWLSNLPEQAIPEAQQMWNDLEHEHGSQGFFDVLQLLLPPDHFQTDLDAQHYRQGTQDLISRVQQLLVAIDRDPLLRERMFNLAATPALCADAGAQIFNRMGIELLEANILADTTPTGLAERESRLVRLARQKWRLAQLNDIVRSDIRHRTASKSEGGLAQAFGSDENQVDEVEVYLAYQTGLKQRLDLPWLSESMVYRNTANVTRQQLDGAYRTVINREYGDGLIDGLLQQDVWSDHLEQTYHARFEQQRSRRAEAGSQLDELIDAQRQWVAEPSGSARKSQLREQLVDLAHQLVIPNDTVLSEHPMTQATQERLYEHIQHDYKELGRQLTRQALVKAGL
ncbi:NEL-type E3 ubiquitin ligase domain-containing protein [Pseudomonas poae]